MVTEQHIHRVYRQHSSLVMTIPKGVVKRLGLGPRDHVILRLTTDGRSFNLQKLIPGVGNAGDITEHLA